MAPTAPRRMTGVERVRHELLTALHFGKLTPGDRAPSVRLLASRTGMDKKTVHRAYTHLAREGLLDLRPGSGTFISESTIPAAELVSAANRARAVANGLGLEPRVLGAFLDIFLGNGLRGMPLLVVECNAEQAGLIELELQSAIGADTRSLMLSKLPYASRAGLRNCEGIVTTDCHFREVAALARPSGIPVYRVALDARFPQRLAEEAAHSDIVMIVPDRKFAAVFAQLLRNVAVPEEKLRRFHIVEPHEAVRLLGEAATRVSVYVSPLVESGFPSHVLAGAHRLPFRWRIEPVSFERLKAGLALDLATRRVESSAKTVGSQTRRGAR